MLGGGSGGGSGGWGRKKRGEKERVAWEEVDRDTGEQRKKGTVKKEDKRKRKKMASKQKQGYTV